MAHHLAKNIAVGALLLIGAPLGWAGPGDIDPNFGSGGRLQPGSLLVLPDDRLVIGAGADGGIRVTRFDANGKVDPTFRDGGAPLIYPPILSGFDVYGAAQTPDGGLLFAGMARNAGLTQVLEAVLRLDRDGHLVTSFGGRNDGFYRLTDAPHKADPWGYWALMGIVADAEGRVLLANRSWTADGRCGGPTSVVRLTPSGTPDPAFGTNGRAEVPVDLCGGTALFGARNDGSIVVGARGAIVGLDATGALDWAFGVGGHVSHGRPNDWGRGFLLPDGGILIVEHDSSTTASNAVLTKFDRGGQLDSTFGTGGGSVPIDLGPVFFGISGSRQSIHDFVLAPDALHISLKLGVLHPDGTTACAGGIARVSFDGTPDLGFGKQGLTCLDYGAFSFSLIASQRNGSPLFQHQGWQTGGVYRLLADATPSPGMLMVHNRSRVNVSEADGTMTVPVVRTAGHDGAVSVSFSTGPRQWDDDLFPGGGDNPTQCNATPGSDFLAASGRLDWADADEVQREIRVSILDDEVWEPCERFRIAISNPQGGALTLENDVFPDYQASVDVAIIDDDEAAIPPTPTPPTPAAGTPTPPGVPVSPDGSGGGGAMSWGTLLVLSGLLFARRRRELAKPHIV
jgi:uncharacterized delta-60 repeat protein